MFFRGTLALQSSIAALLSALEKGVVEWFFSLPMLKFHWSNAETSHSLNRAVDSEFSSDEIESSSDESGYKGEHAKKVAGVYLKGGRGGGKL